MTNTDTQYTARFSPSTIPAFVANQSDLAGYERTESPLNTGLMSDIGRVTVYNPDIQPSAWSRFMRDPLSYGDAAMKTTVGEVTSRAYNPLAPDTALFDGQRPTFTTSVAKKNLSRQIAVEIHDGSQLAQYCQVPEMRGDVQDAIMATSNVCYMDDMWVAAKAYFSGTVAGAKAGQVVKMNNAVPGAEAPSEDKNAFGEEFTNVLWDFLEKKFAFKSDKYNISGRMTRPESVSVLLKKDVAYPAFKKLLADTFNPEILNLNINGGIDYVDDFATPAGAPGTGELLGIVVDDRAFDIVPMPDGLTVEAFRNPARKSTAYFTTYEYAFQNSPMFDVGYIFAPDAAA